jgi:hypothetical protein
MSQLAVSICQGISRGIQAGVLIGPKRTCSSKAVRILTAAQAACLRSGVGRGRTTWSGGTVGVGVGKV